MAQPGVILQDLRIATILNELNAVNALSLSASMSPVLDFVMPALILLIVFVFGMVIQGCKAGEMTAIAACIELWFV